MFYLGALGNIHSGGGRELNGPSGHHSGSCGRGGRRRGATWWLIEPFGGWGLRRRTRRSRYRAGPHRRRRKDLAVLGGDLPLPGRRLGRQLPEPERDLGPAAQRHVAPAEGTPHGHGHRRVDLGGGGWRGTVALTNRCGVERRRRGGPNRQGLRYHRSSGRWSVAVADIGVPVERPGRSRVSWVDRWGQSTAVQKAVRRAWHNQAPAASGSSISSSGSTNCWRGVVVVVLDLREEREVRSGVGSPASASPPVRQRS